MIVNVSWVELVQVRLRLQGIICRFGRNVCALITNVFITAQIKHRLKVLNYVEVKNVEQMSLCCLTV